jgi:putative aminopeptidase FrvX
MELLKRLYEIHSPSGQEIKLVFFLRDWILENVPEAEYRIDDIGNFYVRKGEYAHCPVVVAHLDQVQEARSADFQAVEAGDIIYGFSASHVLMEGLGADDKNGIWIALQCLRKFPSIKCCFFAREEEGCVGSKACDLTFFEDAHVVIACDRKGAHDLITDIDGTELCDQAFLSTIDYVTIGYQPQRGLMTDVGQLKKRGLQAPCINLSCGFYRPHTDEEYTRKSELLNCLAFVEHIIARFD